MALGNTALVMAARLAPRAFKARTANVYVVPLVKPGTTVLKVDAPTEMLAGPGLATMLYPVMALPPSLPGTDQLTVAEPFPGEALAPTGVPGTVAGITL